MVSEAKPGRGQEGYNLCEIGFMTRQHQDLEILVSRWDKYPMLSSLSGGHSDLGRCGSFDNTVTIWKGQHCGVVFVGDDQTKLKVSHRCDGSLGVIRKVHILNLDEFLRGRFQKI